MKQIFLLITLLLIFMGSDIQAQTLKVPFGKPIMLDGKFSQDEWKDALEKPISDNVKLYFKQSDEYLLICVRMPTRITGVVDLYVSPSNKSIINLHASAKLGERLLENGVWPEWKWWNNVDWVANVARVESFQKTEFLPEDVKEIQIRRAKFSATAWQMMFEISLIAGQNIDKKILFPTSTSNVKSANWLTIDLSK
ncbi:MAG: hypothetical protein AB1489_14095 [Acidobacteriota bacterium]